MVAVIKNQPPTVQNTNKPIRDSPKMSHQPVGVWSERPAFHKYKNRENFSWRVRAQNCTSENFPLYSTSCAMDDWVFCSFLSESWYHFNDSTVTETHSQWVASCRAYILFYIQRDINSKYSSKRFWWRGVCVCANETSATMAAVKSLFWSVMDCDA